MSFARGGLNLGSAFGTIGLDAGSALSTLSALSAGLRALSGPSASASRSLDGIQRSLDGINRGFGAARNAVAAGIAGLGIEKLSRATVTATADLETAVKNVQSIADGLDFRKTFGALTDLSTRVPETAIALGDGLYNIFSSIEVSFDGAMTLLEQFSRGAAAAQTDSQSFGSAILGVMNAYKLSVADAARVQDVFFNTVKFGVVTGRELASNLGVVTASAKTAGVTIEELGAAIAGVTKEGGPAAQNINNLANFFNKVVTTDAAKEMRALGVAVADAQGNIRPIFDVLADLRAALAKIPSEAKRAQALQAIFPDAQARQGAVVLMSQLDNIRKFLRANQTEAGSAAKAYETMTATFNAASAVLRNVVTALLTDIGQVILPGLTQRVLALTEVLRGVRAVLTDLPGAAGQLVGRLTGLTTDIGLLEGVTNRVFGQDSPILGGLRTFLALTDRLRDGAGAAFRALAEAIGLTDTPLGRFLEGWGELARSLGERLFPANTDDEFQAVGQGMDRVRASAEKNRSGVQRFGDAVRTLLDRIRTTPEVQALVTAFGNLAEATKKVLEAVGNFIKTVAAPFFPATTATTIDAVGTALGRLAGTQPDTATRALTAIRDLLSGAATLISTGADNLTKVAAALQLIGEKVAASGAVTNLKTALDGLLGTIGQILQPLQELARTFLNGLFPPTMDREIKVTGRGMEALRKSAQIDETQQTAATVAARITESLTTLAAAVRSVDEAITTTQTRLTDFGAAMAPLAEPATKLGGALLLFALAMDRLLRAPFEGIAQGLRDIDSAAGGRNIDRFGKVLDALAAVLYVQAGAADAAAFAIERLLTFLTRAVVALERLASGDTAGAAREIKTAWEELRKTASQPPIDASKAVNSKSFSDAKKDVVSQLDAIKESMKRGGDTGGIGITAKVEADTTAARTTLGDVERQLAELGRSRATPSVDADPTAALGQIGKARQALDEVDRRSASVSVAADTETAVQRLLTLKGQIDTTPRSFTVTANVDISQATGRLTEFARMLPHSPAEEGPLAFQPDWSYLTANLPEVMGEMVRLVQEVGEQIGGKAQIERFSAIANAISAAAGAVGATVSGLEQASTFVRPAVTVLDDLQATLADVLGRIRSLAGALTKEQAEKIQSVTSAATSAMGALGATVEAMTKAREFTGPAIGQVQDAVDHMAGLLFRLRDLGLGLTPTEIGRVGAIGQAAQAAMGGLAAAIEPLTRLRTFTGPAIGQVQDAVDHIAGVMVRLSELGLAFTGQQVQQAQALGDAVQAAMGGLNEAVTALTAVRSFTGFDPGLLEGLFGLLSNVAVRMRDLSQAFTGQQVQQAQATAEAVRTSFEALAAAVEVLPKLAEANLPDTGQAIAAFARAIELAMQRIVEIAGRLGPEAVRAAGEFADSAGKVVDLLGAGAEAFAALGDLQEVSAGQIDRYARGVRLAVQAVAQLAREVGPLLTKEAAAFAETAGKALGVLSAVGSFNELAEFRAPSRRQIDSFFAVLRVAVDALVAEGQRIAPEIARRTGQVGADLGKALGAVGTAVTAFSALSQFQPGKRFSAQLDGLFAFIEQAIARMRGLGGLVGDPKQLLAIASAIEAIGRALSAFVQAATGAGEIGDLRAVLALVDRLASAGQATILGRTEHVVRFEGGITVKAEGFTAGDQAVADATASAVREEVSERLRDELIGAILGQIAGAVREVPAR